MAESLFEQGQAREIGHVLPPGFVWWRHFAARYFGGLCGLSLVATAGNLPSQAVPSVPPPTDGELATLVLTTPVMPGAEYLTADVMRMLWGKLGMAFAASLAASGTDLQGFLKALNPAWNLLGRVHFNLAENRRDHEYPFAFMATYTTRLSAQAKAQHVPLGQAMLEYAGLANRDKLLSLLTPVQRASETCDWLRAMVDAGEIFHPLRWTAAEAARFLKSAPELEGAGVVLRMPAKAANSTPAMAPLSLPIGFKPRASMACRVMVDFLPSTTAGKPRFGGAFSLSLSIQEGASHGRLYSAEWNQCSVNKRP